MNYFEIFNKVLLELNYRAVQSFDSIYKSEHKKILNAINRVNSEVLASYEWDFLEKQTLLDVDEGQNIYQLPFKGIIKAVYKDDERVLYTANSEGLLAGRLTDNFYSVSKNSIIVQKPRQKETYRIIYEGRDFAMGQNGEFKEKLTDKDDCSVLPMPFAEHILVYGACLKVKANPSYPKFGFWNTMYIQALTNLLQKSPQTKECEPFINLA